MALTAVTVSAQRWQLLLLSRSHNPFDDLIGNILLILMISEYVKSTILHRPT